MDENMQHFASKLPLIIVRLFFLSFFPMPSFLLFLVHLFHFPFFVCVCLGIVYYFVANLLPSGMSNYERKKKLITNCVTCQEQQHINLFSLMLSAQSWTKHSSTHTHLPPDSQAFFFLIIIIIILSDSEFHIFLNPQQSTKSERKQTTTKNKS